MPFINTAMPIYLRWSSTTLREEFIHSTHYQLPLITMLFSMFQTLGVFTTILSISGVSVAMVVNRDSALDRKGMSKKCSG